MSLQRRQLNKIKDLNLMAYFLRHCLIPAEAILIGAALGFTGLAAYLYESARSQYIPYIVTVDKQGAVLAQEALPLEQQISDKLLAFILCDFIENMYAKSADEQIQRDRIKKVYALLEKGSSATTTVNSFYTQHNPLDISELYQVDVTSIKRIGEHSFELNFIQRALNKNAATPGQMHNLSLSYSLASNSADDFEMLRLNPLGIQINELNFSQITMQEDYAQNF